MATLYNPTLKRGATAITLNTYGPLETTGETYGKRYRNIEVPLRAGSITGGIARSSCTISVSGVLYAASRALLYSYKDIIQNFLNNNDLPFHFYRFRDTTNSYYRWWPNCICQSLNFSNTSRTKIYLPWGATFFCPSGKELISGIFPNEGSGSGDNGTDPAPTDDTLTLDGPTVIQLADAAGASKLVITDVNNNVVAQIDSVGNIIYKGTAYQDENLA